MGIYATSMKKMIFKLYNESHSIEELTALYNVDRSTIYKWFALYRETGRFENTKAVRKPNKVNDEEILAIVIANPDILQREIAVKFGVVSTTIGNAF